MSLGSLIAKARKDAALSIDDLSAKTNILPSVLREIEKDNFANCGGETYARGHLRTIAAVLKEDQKEFIRLYEEEQGAEIRSIQELLIENNVMHTSEESRKVSWKVLILISLVSLFVVAFAQIILSNRDSNNVVSPTPTVSATSSVIPTESPKAEPSAQNTFSTGSGVEVVIRAARAKSWLFVSDAVGRTLFSGQISQGSVKTFTSDSQLNLKVGNAGGVDLTVNGTQVPVIGADGQVVSVSYGVDS
jgi:cytoskeletal protein RodZ